MWRTGFKSLTLLCLPEFQKYLGGFLRSRQDYGGFQSAILCKFGILSVYISLFFQFCTSGAGLGTDVSINLFTLPSSNKIILMSGFREKLAARERYQTGSEVGPEGLLDRLF